MLVARPGHLDSPLRPPSEEDYDGIKSVLAFVSCVFLKEAFMELEITRLINTIARTRNLFSPTLFSILPRLTELLGVYIYH